MNKIPSNTTICKQDYLNIQSIYKRYNSSGMKTRLSSVTPYGRPHVTKDSELVETTPTFSNKSNKNGQQPGSFQTLKIVQTCT